MRKLLATMYKVLVLADSVIVGEIMQAKEKVCRIVLRIQKDTAVFLFEAGQLL